MSHPYNLVIANPLIDLAGATESLLLSVSPGSRRTYTVALKHFYNWLLSRDLVPARITYQVLGHYQAELLASFARATAATRIAVVRSLFDEHAKLTGAPNPTRGLKPIHVANESPHVALTRSQARDLLRAIDQSTLIGKRNYAIIKLLLHTGLRRSECAALSIGDIRQQEGHFVANIEHGKGDKRRLVKLKGEVLRAIADWLAENEAWNKSERGKVNPRDLSPEAPLFTQIGKGGNLTSARISDKVIERLVKRLARQIAEPRLTPHGLRATFITLAKEGGASLEQRQFAAGHADARTTQRYDRRKLNLDDNAADYIRIDA